MMPCPLQWQPTILQVTTLFRPLGKKTTLMASCCYSSCLWWRCLLWRCIPSNIRFGGKIWSRPCLQHPVNGTRDCWVCGGNGICGTHCDCRNPVRWLHLPCVWSGKKRKVSLSDHHLTCYILHRSWMKQPNLDIDLGTSSTWGDWPFVVLAPQWVTGVIIILKALKPSLPTALVWR